MGTLDGDFELDLSRFEEKQQRRYAAATGQDEQPEQDDELEVERSPWEDERSFDELYSADSLWKARSLVLDHRVEKVSDQSFIVQGSQAYRVSILAGEQEVPWAVCSCPNGEKRGGRPSCYHTAAVLATILGIDLTHVPKPQKYRRT